MARRTRSAEPEPGVVPELAERLRLTMTRLGRRLRRRHAPGLSPTQMTVLVAVESVTLTLGELAAQEHVQPPTMTVVVHRLQEEGLVRRVTDELDRRVVRVEITEAGRRLLAERRVFSNAYLASLIELLSPEDQEILVRAVDVLDGVLDRERLRRDDEPEEGAAAPPTTPDPR